MEAPGRRVAGHQTEALQGGEQAQGRRLRQGWSLGEALEHLRTIARQPFQQIDAAW